MKHFLSFVLKLDILGSNFRLLYKKQSTTKSLFGSFLSICLFALSIVATFFFGKDTFFREEPITSMTQDYVRDNQIPLKDSPVVLIILDKNGDPILDTDVMDSFNIVSYLYNISVEDNYAVNTVPLAVERCSRANMTSENYDLLEKDYNPSTFLCVDPFHILVNGEKQKFDAYFRNPFGFKDSAFVAFALQKCDETVKPGCSQAFREEDQIFINQMVFESYIDFSNFEKPAKKYLKNVAYEVSFSMFKRVYMKMTLNSIFTDEGHVFKSERQFDFHSVEEVNIDLKIFSDNDPFYFDLFKEVNFKKNIYYRRYLKIQEVIANVGGFMKACFFICRFIVKYYCEYLFFIKFSKEFPEKKVIEQEVKSTASNSNLQKEKLSFWNYLTSRVSKASAQKHSINRHSYFKYTDLHYITTHLRLIEAKQEDKMPNSFRY